MTSHGAPMNDIQHWWKKALHLSHTEDLGHHLMRFFELMQSVIDTGLKDEILPLKAEALRMDSEIALAEDPSRDEFVALHYGMTACICIMLVRKAEEEGNGLHSPVDRSDELELWRNRSLQLKIMALSMECSSLIADDPNRESLSRSLHYGVIFALCTMLKSLKKTPIMSRERPPASMTVKDFEDMSIDEFRSHFHRLLRICANHRKVLERRNLLTLLFAYHHIERDQPLLNLETMTEDEKMNIREYYTRVLDALFDEEAMIGSADIRSVVAGYTLFRTEIHPVAQQIFTLGSSNVYYIGRYLLSELRICYWAFGPEFDKRLGMLACDADDLDGWWCGNRAITPEDRNRTTPYVKRAKDRIHHEYKLTD